MVADGLLTRQRYREVPPRVDYELTERARDLLPVVGALARWGYQWCWTAPRAGEAVDIGAVLRSLPGLEAPKGFKGLARVVVTRRGEDDRVYAVTSRKGAVSVTEGDAGDAVVTITGSEAAWVAALGPAADRGRLELSGNDTVAHALLDGLTPVRASEAAVA